jgi:hypothetical protein
MAMVRLLAGTQSSAQIRQLAEMGTEQIRKLGRAHTVILLPGGILEEHGPYLPSYTDGYAIEALTQELARGIAVRPEVFVSWNLHGAARNVASRVHGFEQRIR